MLLSNLELKRSYRRSNDNMLKDFYNPVLSVAIKYKRAVEYFTISSLINASEGLSNLIEKGGRVEIVKKDIDNGTTKPQEESTLKGAVYGVYDTTSNLLILFDELGRGTATFDGMALAQSIIEYIHDNIKCKTLFSTHYHELTDLENNLKNLKNIHVSAVEEDGNITFLHKIKNGSIDKSYGIHVVKLANLPD